MLRIPTWLKNAEADLFAADFEDLFGDAELSGTIDYHRWSAGATPTVDLNAGLLTNPYTTSSAVPAFVGAWQAHQLLRYGARVAVGDLKCMFSKGNVSGALGPRDRVTYGSLKYEVLWVRQAQFGAAAASQLVLVNLRRPGGKGA